MVGARVELVCVSDLDAVAHLDFGAICPLDHQGFQIKVVVHSFIVEFLLLNLITGVFESEVDPVQGVK